MISKFVLKFLVGICISNCILLEYENTHLWSENGTDFRVYKPLKKESSSGICLAFIKDQENLKVKKLDINCKEPKNPQKRSVSSKSEDISLIFQGNWCDLSVFPDRYLMYSHSFKAIFDILRSLLMGFDKFLCLVCRLVLIYLDEFVTKNGCFLKMIFEGSKSEVLSISVS